MDQGSEKRDIAARIGQLRGLDTLDGYKIRLVGLRTRIETNWPESGGGVLRRRKGMGKEAAAAIAELLVALPTPLPLSPGAKPEPLVPGPVPDLRLVAGRAVDAAMALLDGGSLDATYPGEVRMLESNRPGSPEPIAVSEPSVGLLVATIIGTLEAISEDLSPTPPVLGLAQAEQAARAAQAEWSARSEPSARSIPTRHAAPASGEPSIQTKIDRKNRITRP